MVVLLEALGSKNWKRCRASWCRRNLLLHLYYLQRVLFAFCLFVLEPHPEMLSLLLALYSRIIPDYAYDYIWDPWYQT